jgi:hypothetical protein
LNAIENEGVLAMMSGKREESGAASPAGRSGKKVSAQNRLGKLMAWCNRAFRKVQEGFKEGCRIVGKRRYSLLGAFACIVVAVWVLVAQGGHALVEHRVIPIPWLSRTVVLLAFTCMLPQGWIAEMSAKECGWRILLMTKID